mgnify:CR=1 FL=1
MASVKRELVEFISTNSYPPMKRFKSSEIHEQLDMTSPVPSKGLFLLLSGIDQIDPPKNPFSVLSLLYSNSSSNSNSNSNPNPSNSTTSLEISSPTTPSHQSVSSPSDSIDSISSTSSPSHYFPSDDEIAEQITTLSYFFLFLFLSFSFSIINKLTSPKKK